MELSPPQERRDGSREDSGTVRPIPLLIHVGLHKTGTSWLQKYLFNAPERGFTSFSSEPGPERKQLIKRLVVPDPLFFDAEETASYYEPWIDAARETGRTLVITHERLGGHPASGGRDRCIIAERLRTSFPEARILIGIREQCRLIHSLYNHHVEVGGVESLKQFLTTSATGNLRRPTFTLEMYEFDRLIRFYQDLFGPERVLVLPLEMLAREPQRYVDAIMGFCGHPSFPVEQTEPVNVRRPQLMRIVQRPLNMLFSHNDLSPGALYHVHNFQGHFKRFLPLFKRLSIASLDRRIAERQLNEVKAFVGTHFSNSNLRTQQLTGLPLRDFGYMQ